MVDIDTFISLIKDGFINLSISEKYKEAALQNIKLWLTDPMFQEYVPQIQYWVESKKWDKLLNSFYQVLPFGTGGRRGSVGIGPNRINGWTIQSSAQGHSRYLINKFGEEAKKRGIVLTYDVRKYTQKGVYNDKISNPVQNLDGERLSYLLKSMQPTEFKSTYIVHLVVLLNYLSAFATYTLFQVPCSVQATIYQQTMEKKFMMNLVDNSFLL